MLTGKNEKSASFESYLPEDWESRILHSSEFSQKRLRVFTPGPEDLAVMKVFRYVAKDAEDIEKLARLKPFCRDAFKERFVHSLPFAIGEPSWHAQSFLMIWNHLYPETPTNAEELLL